MTSGPVENTIARDAIIRSISATISRERSSAAVACAASAPIHPSIPSEHKSVSSLTRTPGKASSAASSASRLPTIAPGSIVRRKMSRARRSSRASITRTSSCPTPSTSATVAATVVRSASSSSTRSMRSSVFSSRSHSGALTLASPALGRGRGLLRHAGDAADQAVDPRVALVVVLQLESLHDRPGRKLDVAVEMLVNGSGQGRAEQVGEDPRRVVDERRVLLAQRRLLEHEPEERPVHPTEVDRPARPVVDDLLGRRGRPALLGAPRVHPLEGRGEEPLDQGDGDAALVAEARVDRARRQAG